MSDAYERLGETDRSRVNTVIIDAFRNAGPAEWKDFRTKMASELKSNGGDYDKAFQTYIDNMRDVLAANIDKLPSDVQNGKVSRLDIGAERNTLRQIRSVLKAEHEDNQTRGPDDQRFWSSEQMKGKITELGNRFGIPDVGPDGKTFKLDQLMRASDPINFKADPKGVISLGEKKAGLDIKGGEHVAMGDQEPGLHSIAAAKGADIGRV